MAKLNRKQMHERARAMLATQAGGLRESELVRTIHAADPETLVNSIRGAMHALLRGSPDIEKVAKGVFALNGGHGADPVHAEQSDEESAASPDAVAATLKEEDSTRVSPAGWRTRTRRRSPSRLAVQVSAVSGARLTRSAC